MTTGCLGSALHWGWAGPCSPWLHPSWPLTPQAQATGKGPLACLKDHLSNPAANNWLHNIGTCKVRPHGTSLGGMGPPGCCAVPCLLGPVPLSKAAHGFLLLTASPSAPAAFSHVLHCPDALAPHAPPLALRRSPTALTLMASPSR